MNKLIKITREPLVHFMFIGAAIYILYGFFAEPVQLETENTIVVSAGEIEWMQTAWQKRWNRTPTDKELEGLIQQHIKETVLYREAMTLGLNKHDAVIRRRLAQKLEFLGKDLVALTPPSDQELQAYFDEYSARYQKAVSLTFSQIFIDPDKRGDNTLDDAEKIKAMLMAQGKTIDKAEELGDSLMLQSYYPEADQAEIKKLFGSGFAQAIIKLSPGQWHGPVPSGYGVHLVNVHKQIKPPAPVLSEVRETVVRDWEADKVNEFNEKFYDNLRDRYKVVIEKTVLSDNANKLASLRQQAK